MPISNIMLRGLCGELERRGLSSKVLLADIDVDRDRLRTAGQLSVDEFGEALRLAMRMTGDEGLGLQLGATAPEHMLQVVGHLMLSADTLREAYELFSRYAGLLASELGYSLEERGERAIFHLQLDAHSLGRRGARFASEFCMAMALRVLLHFSPHTEPVEVGFAHVAPSYQARYEQLFRCPISFGRPTTSLSFPRAVLDQRSMHGDETMRAFLRDAAEQLLDQAQRRLSVGERLRAAIRARPEGWNQDAEALARRLGLTRRALGRRLRREGLTIAAIVEEERCRAACRQLSRPGCCIKETAERLGYSEPSAFHRAFKRWTGKTPAEFMRAPRGEVSHRAA